MVVVEVVGVAPVVGPVAIAEPAVLVADDQRIEEVGRGGPGGGAVVQDARATLEEDSVQGAVAQEGVDGGGVEMRPADGSPATPGP